MTQPSTADIANASNRYSSGDPMFRQGYGLIFDGGLDGRRVLEVCCGEGDLAEMIARLGRADVTAVDASDETLAVARAKHPAGVTFVRGDASSLTWLESNSMDVVVGQAAMHHLSHNLAGFSTELHRVLKPGGRAIFINEPMGHNALVAAVRGIRNSRNHWIDEANLFEEAIEIFGRPFTRHAVYHFGLLSYAGKVLPRRMPLADTLYGLMNAADQGLFRIVPGLGKYAANFNACFWK